MTKTPMHFNAIPLQHGIPPSSIPVTVYMDRIHLAANRPGLDGAALPSQSDFLAPKRNRAQLSCTSCRHGKLKCDRQQPCSQCVRRGRAAQCNFMPAERRKPVVSLQNRLKHLESLVKDAMTAQNPSVHGTLSNSPDTPNGSRLALRSSVHSISSYHDQDQANGQQSPPSGQVLLSNGQTYVGASHWAAILEDV